MKRILSCVLTLAMALGLISGLAGCGRKEAYNPDNFLPNGTAENPYQIVKDPITLNIFVPKSPMNPHFNEMKISEALPADQPEL